ncbi:MAG: hypothetical protein A2Y25_10785 [Candidatus Melainabacteria bacterium GWF2_37_15]|nr:MAG: hypothetical protein A2Y25_10785 [Candidatus Melainabacteria bacterium GWF2_37_15]
MEFGGKITVNKKHYGKYLPQGKSGEVVFGKEKKERKVNPSAANYEEAAGLNDLDSNILNKNFEQNIPKKSLRLEMQLEKAEKKLKNVKEEMKMNEVLNVQNPEHDEKLRKTRERLEKEITAHREEYKRLGFTYQIADIVSQVDKAVSEKALQFKEIVIKFVPSAKERKKVEYARMLDNKLSRELRKSAISRSEDLEPLLFQAEKLNKANKLSSQP